MDKLNKLSILLFCIGLGLRYSGGTLLSVKPTLIVLISVIISLFSVFSNNKLFFNKQHLYICAFLIYCFFTNIVTMAPNYGIMKVIILMLWVFSFFVLAPNIVQNSHLFFKSIFVSLILLLVLFYLQFGSPFDLLGKVSTYYRLGDEGTNPNSFSRFLGMGVLSGIFIYKKKIKLSNIIIVLTLVVALLYMLLSGSKGPLFSLLISVFIYLLSKFKKIRWKLWLFVLVLIISYMFIELSLSNVMTDFINNRFLNSDRSLSTRNERYSAVLNSFKLYTFNDLKLFVFGNGSGNFSYLFENKDHRSYPHNIILEILYEYGLIGILLFLKAIVSPVYIAIRSKLWRNDFVKAIIICWIYLFINSMVSTDLAGNFILFGLTIILIRQSKILRE